MRLGDVSDYAWANLGRHKLRTGLTVCGVALGIMTLTVLVSLGSGLKLFFTNQFDREVLTTRIRVLPKGTKEATRSLLSGSTGGVQIEKPLDDAAVAELAKIDGVEFAYPEIITVVGAYANRRIAPVLAETLPQQAIGASHQGALLAGRYWEGDAEAGAVCVLPSSLLRGLGFADPQAALGLTLELSNVVQLQDYKQVTEQVENPQGGPPLTVKRFERHKDVDWKPLEVTVVGVYDSRTFGYAGRMVHVPKPLGLKLAVEYDVRNRYRPGEYRQVVVTVAKHQDLVAVEQAAQAKGYETQSVFDVLRQIRVLFLGFQAVLALFGGIGVAVAFFGIANTMVMAVLERTREIGVLKALGARDRDVRRMFVVEAAGIGVLGGALGLVGGWATGIVFNAIAFRVWQPLQEAGLNLFVIETWVVVACLSLSTLVATAAGLIPAIRAARLAPVDALRRE